MSTNRHGSDLKTFLQMKKVSPEKVAEALGISPRAVYYWLAGKREPRLTIRQVQSLCILLDCSVHDLPSEFGNSQGEGDTAPTAS